MSVRQLRVAILDGSPGLRVTAIGGVRCIPSDAADGPELGLEVAEVLHGEPADQLPEDQRIWVGDLIVAVEAHTGIDRMPFTEAKQLMLEECRRVAGENKSSSGNAPPQIRLSLVTRPSNGGDERKEAASSQQDQANPDQQSSIQKGESSVVEVDEPEKRAQRQQALRMLMACVLLDMVGVGVVIPSLPAISEQVGGGATHYGLVQMFYGLGQLLGSPISGWLSDRFGRRVVLLSSFVGSCLAYGAVGASGSLAWLMGCRLAVGLVKQTNTVSTAYVSDVTPWRQRTAALGKLQSFSFLGFMLGPILGSVLAMRSGIRMPFYVSAGIFSLLSAAAYLWLPQPEQIAVDSSSAAALDSEMDPEVEKVGAALRCPFNPHATGPNPHIKQQTPAAIPKADPNTPVAGASFVLRTLRVFQDMREVAAQRPLLFRVLGVRVAAQAANLLMQSVMLMHLGRRYSMESVLVFWIASFLVLPCLEDTQLPSPSPFPLCLRPNRSRRTNGFFLAYNGLLGILVNVFAVGPICRRLGGEMPALTLGCFLGGLGCIWGGYSGSLAMYFVSCVALNLGVNTQRTASTSLFTQLCPADRRGAYLGYSDAADALSRVLMPLLGGLLLDWKPAAPFVLAGAAQILVGMAWDSATRQNMQRQETMRQRAVREGVRVKQE